jgi:hypothetical protein
VTHGRNRFRLAAGCVILKTRGARTIWLCSHVIRFDDRLSPSSSSSSSSSTTSPVAVYKNPLSAALFLLRPYAVSPCSPLPFHIPNPPAYSMPWSIGADLVLSPQLLSYECITSTNNSCIPHLAVVMQISALITVPARAPSHLFNLLFRPQGAYHPLFISYPFFNFFFFFSIHSSAESVSSQSISTDLITPDEPALNYYDSPPTPPQSLEDQIQEAYALDNIHLAKILYLKLKGIEVLDDSDPRINQVRDEDFPFSRLNLDEEDERNLKEYKEREQARRLEQQRESRLAACELIWTRSVAQYREDRLKVVQRKEAAALAAAEQRRWQTEAQDRESVKQGRPRLPHFQHVGTSTRGLLSYKSLGQHRLSQSSSPPDSESMFEYTVMRPISTPSSLCRPKKPYSGPRDCSIQSTSSCYVPFRDVSASMRGPLFPFQPDQDAIHYDTRAGKRVRLDLLDVLLNSVQSTDAERRNFKGKDKDLPLIWSPSERTLCAACSAASKPTSSPATLVSRSASWLNLGGTISKIASSYTPQDSQMSHPSRGVPVMGSLMASSSHSNLTTRPLRHSCHKANLASVLPHECPLSSHVSPSQHDRTQSSRPREPHPGPFAKLDVVRRVGGSISSFFDLASQLQAAYARATVFSVTVQTDSIQGRNTLVGDKRLKSVGCRAKASDVMTFAGRKEGGEDDVENAGSVPLISIAELVERRNMLTSATASLPYITTSPFRPRERPTCLQYRIRPVANPMMLRLKALQNLCCVTNMEWKGRAKEGTLGFGKERMAGVAFEGIGRSGLSWEVS